MRIITKMNNPSQRTMILYLLLVTIVLILYGSFYPFRFELENFQHLRASLMFERTQIQRSGYADMLGNLLFYIPLGMVLINALPKEWNSSLRMLMTILLGALLSFTVEYLQQLTFNRVSSALDLALNTISTMIGACIGRIFQIDEIHVPQIVKPNSPHAIPVFLIGLWFAFHAIPFIPNIGIYKLTHRILELSEMQYTLNGVAFWVAGYLIVFLALRALIRENLFWWALIILTSTSLIARLIFLNQHLSVDECLGLIGAFILIVCTIKIPLALLAKPAFHLIWILLLIAALGPFTFTDNAQSFHWIPFAGFLEAGSEHGYVSFILKLYIYTGTFWLAVLGGMRLKNAVIILLYVTTLSEYLQRYLPGRTPEITELLMVLISALVVLVMQGSSKETNQ
jgi:glycopeptide antibiotics resistance protein